MIILDTNVISELMKGRKCSENVYQWTSQQPINELFTKTITQGEFLNFGKGKSISLKFPLSPHFPNSPSVPTQNETALLLQRGDTIAVLNEIGIILWQPQSDNE